MYIPINVLPSYVETWHPAGAGPPSLFVSVNAEDLEPIKRDMRERGETYRTERRMLRAHGVKVEVFVLAPTGHRNTRSGG